MFKNMKDGSFYNYNERNVSHFEYSHGYCTAKDVVTLYSSLGCIHSTSGDTGTISRNNRYAANVTTPFALIKARPITNSNTNIRT